MTCPVCQEPYLSGETPEVPVRLRCGHTIGQGCILKWVNPLEITESTNTCPICRTPVVNPMITPESMSAIRSMVPEVGFGEVYLPQDEPSANAENAVSQEALIGNFADNEFDALHGDELDAMLIGLIPEMNITPDESGANEAEASPSVSPLTITENHASDDEEHGTGAIGVNPNTDTAINVQPVINDRVIDQRLFWLQFCEGIIRVAERADKPFMTAILAQDIILLHSVEDYKRYRESRPADARLIEEHFPSMQAEFDQKVGTSVSLHGIDISSLIEQEQNWDPELDVASLHTEAFRTRLYRSYFGSIPRRLSAENQEPTSQIWET